MRAKCPYSRLVRAAHCGDDIAMKLLRTMSGPAGACGGLTLPELLITLSLAAIVSAAAAPSFRSQRAAVLASSAANSLLTSLHHARSVALLRGQPTVVCLSADGAQCLAAARQRAQGWIEFQNTHSESPPRLDPADTLLGAQSFDAELAIRGSRSAVAFWPVSRAGTTATFTLCAGEPVSAARAVIVSQSGRPRTKLLPPLDPGCRP